MRVGLMKCHNDSIDGIYDVTFAVNTHAPTKRHVQNKCFTFVLRGVGEGWQGGHVPPLSKVCGGGGHKWVCGPHLLDRANVLISLFAHIL